MPEISPVVTTVDINGVDSTLVEWSNIQDGDTIAPYEVPGTTGINGCLQVMGVFGGARVTFKNSNVDTVADFLPMKGLDEYKLTTKKPAVIDFSTAARFFMPEVIGGEAYVINVRVILR